MDPCALDSMGLPRRLGATIVQSAAYARFGKTVAGTSASHLDYFLVSDALLNLIQGVRVLSTKPNPHMPVVLQFYTFRSVVKVRVPVRYAAFPDDRP